MLNLKDPEANALAREIAQADGTSLEAAVVGALREKAARLRLAGSTRPVSECGSTAEDKRARYERIMAAIREAQASWLPDFPSREQIDEEMYDEFGLPR